MQYWNYILCKGYVPGQNNANYFATFREQFVLTLSRIAYSWFKQVIPAYHDIEDVKVAFLKRFNEWGQTVKQHVTAWNNLKFDLNKHDMDVFACQLQWLASLLYMTEDQTLKKFKDTFDMNIAAHLIKCATLDEAREKAGQLVFIYKSNNPMSASTLLVHAQQPDKREVQEHQLAAVGKVDKQRVAMDKPRGGNNNSQNRINSQQNHSNQSNRGQGNYRQQRGRFNYRGNNQRDRGYYQNDHRQNNRGRGYRRGHGYEQSQDNYWSEYQRGQGCGSFCRPWRAQGTYQRSCGFTPSGTGDPQYKGIPQYRYICGICHSRGHYDHQHHTLQHLFHAMQQQSGQHMPQSNTDYDNTNHTDQSAF